MEKLSELISKKIFSFSEGAYVGVISNVTFDQKFNVISLSVIDEQSDTESSVEFGKITTCGENVFVNTVRDLLFVEQLSARIIGKSVFTNKGEYCGTIKEVYLSRKAAICVATDLICFSSNQIGVCGDVIILGKTSKGQTKNVFAPQSEQQQVFALSGEIHKEEAVVPYRVSADYKNLIGKMATKDIFGLNNEILLKKYEIITKKKLLEIKKHNKLNILFYSCK